mmetsp:Transcript_7501/g.8896  ORF Transcript_7501/g.8896 Transcript_7501/m.8896 type:complete len:684 (-) Transcript_7501:147-2198(-)
MNFEDAFDSLTSSSDLITTIIGSDNVVKFISKSISRLGFVDTEIIGTKDYCISKENCGYYLRYHKSGFDIVIETLALNQMKDGDHFLLERIVSIDDVPENKRPFLPTHNVSQVPQEIVQDFVVNGSVGIHWVMPDGVIAWANKADMDICGYNSEHYIGSSVVQYHVDDDTITDILNKLTSNQVLKEYPARLRHKDGSIRHVIIDSSTNFDKDGNFVNTRCFTRDITEHRKLELEKQEAEILAKSAQDALEMKSLFLARMSHDIRTPLNGVIGMTSLLETTELTKEQHEFLQVIESSSIFLLNLLQDILDFSKIEAGKIDLDPQPTNLIKLVEDCASILKVECSKKDVQLQIKKPFNLNPNLSHMVDTNRLKQIILNFLSNAVKFTASGSVIVSIEINPSHHPSTEVTDIDVGTGNVVNDTSDDTSDDNVYDQVLIFVEDTGIGIEDVTKLFRNFEQATKSTTREYGGTGLGLSIAKSLTELMGGKIHIKSALGKGTKIGCDFRFPQHQVQTLSAHTPNILKTSSSLNSKNTNIFTSVEKMLLWKKNCHILVAEDNKINQKVLLNMLKRLDYKNVEIVENGLLAFNEFSTFKKMKKYDLILMDCYMPVMDGKEATQAIRNFEDELYAQDDTNCLGRIPIIALTANAQESDRLDCLESGMDGFLTKPINMKTLDEEILKWMPKVL